LVLVTSKRKSRSVCHGFDQRNQLVWAKHSDTDGGAVDLQVDFKYDAFGNRIEKAHDADGAGGGSAVVTRFALDGWKNVRQPLVGNENWDVWADLDGSSSLTTRYVRGDVIDQFFARIDRVDETDTPYWYLTDHPGSIRDVIDGSAAVKNAITYDGFGNITAETDTNYRGRYAWTGREIEVEIELQYNRARYFDAKTGRWISQDPLGFDAGDSNLYRYVANMATTLSDPSGLVNPVIVGAYYAAGALSSAISLYKFVIGPSPVKTGAGAWSVWYTIKAGSSDAREVIRRARDDLLNNAGHPGFDGWAGKDTDTLREAKVQEYQFRMNVKFEEYDDVTSNEFLGEVRSGITVPASGPDSIDLSENGKELEVLGATRFRYMVDFGKNWHTGATLTVETEGIGMTRGAQ
jgi:RHS repeat-associated protein